MGAFRVDFDEFWHEFRRRSFVNYVTAGISGKPFGRSAGGLEVNFTKTHHICEIMLEFWGMA